MTEPRETGGAPAPAQAAEASEIDRLGARLVTSLHAVDKALRVYELNNRAVLVILDDLVDTIREVAGDAGRGARFEIRDDDVFLNGTPLRLGYKIWLRACELGRALRRRGIGGLVLPPEPTRQKLQLFFARLQKVKLVGSPEAALPLSQLATETGGAVLPAVPLEASLAPRERDRLTVRLHAVLVVLLKDLLDAARGGRRITLVPLKRAIQQVADQLDDREGLLLALMDAPGYRGHQETHLANVVVLALAVGRRWRLSSARLMQVALAAAFHDLPTALVPREVQVRRERGEPLGPAEQAAVEAAPTLALQYLLQSPGASAPGCLSEIVTVREARDEFASPPTYLGGLEQSVLSRFLAIVNAYDLLVRPVGPWEPLLPAEAMRWLLVDQAERFDPVLLDAFARVLGLFPTGSLVELSTGAIAVVVQQHAEEGLIGTPVVELLTDDEGEPTAPERVDLATDGRTIRAPLEPRSHGFDPLRHFLRAPGISL
jgi:hypothetical protein